MTSPVYRVTKLTPRFDLRDFDCGEPAYNEWLVQRAVNAVEAGSSMVYLLLERLHPGAEERVVGYYAICPTVVVRDDMPKSLQRGVLRAAPAWLLAKLALDRSLRGDKDHQWGAQLLREALQKIVASVDLGGGQIIVVDADNTDRSCRETGEHQPTGDPQTHGRRLGPRRTSCSAVLGGRHEQRWRPCLGEGSRAQRLALRTQGPHGSPHPSSRRDPSSNFERVCGRSWAAAIPER